MACPRCGGDFETYSLADREAVVCASCGYVGVPTDHTPDATKNESWDDALRRFRARRTDSGETITLDGTRYRVPADLADEVRELTDKQRSVLVALLDEPDPASPDRSYADIADASGVDRSYVGDIVRSYADLAAAIASCETVN